MALAWNDLLACLTANLAQILSVRVIALASWWKPSPPIVCWGWDFLVYFWAMVKWDYNFVQFLFAAGLACHFLVSLPKVVAFLRMIMPTLMSWMLVAGDQDASAIVAYLFKLWKTVATGLVWA